MRKFKHWNENLSLWRPTPIRFKYKARDKNVKVLTKVSLETQKVHTITPKVTKQKLKIYLVKMILKRNWNRQVSVVKTLVAIKAPHSLKNRGTTYCTEYYINIYH